MKNPILVIMAAGMGSRYGGLKQIDPVDAEGHIIIDFSIFDAIRAGFKKVVFIIKHEIEKDFREVIDKHLGVRILRSSTFFRSLIKFLRNFRFPNAEKSLGAQHTHSCAVTELLTLPLPLSMRTIIMELTPSRRYIISL